MIDMASTDICRLCFSKNNLVWVFDKRFENSDSMKYVVFITTGVEINSTDAVSQNICKKCCQITVNFFEFRNLSLNNDKLLKEKLKTVTSKDNVERETPPAAIQVKPEPMDTTESAPNDEMELPIHPSVGDLFKEHPQLKLPRICLTADVKPSVILPMDAVETYYKKRNLNFQEHSKLALKPRSTARKRTSAVLNTMPASTNSPPCLINARIIPQRYADEEKGLVQPIKLRIYSKSMSNESVAESESESYQNLTQNTAPCHRKRKVTDDESATKENEKPEENCNSAEPREVSKSLSYVANVSVPLHMCNICDAVHYNYKDLKKHRHTHLRCQFCKTTFRSLEAKKEHLESKCLIKNTINNFPTIEVPRIESDIDVVTKYSDAFSDYPSIQSREAETLKTVELSSESEEERSKYPETNKCDTAENTLDIIEIISDDDDTSIVKNNVIPVIPTKAPELPPAITPNVKLKDSTVLGVISPTLIKVLVLKDVLSKASLSNLSTDKEVQTEMPHEENIEVNLENQTSVLANLKSHLHVFRVPVTIKNGPFQVSYNLSVDKPKTKNLRFWNDMTPVDVKVNNTGAAVFTECIDRGNEQTKSITEVAVPLTLTNAPLPTAVASTRDEHSSKVPNENSPISNPESGFDKSVNSVVKLSTASNCLPKTNNVVHPTSVLNITGKRTSPPPTPTNITAEPSLNILVTSTSALTPVPARQESTSMDSVCGSTAVASKSQPSTLDHDNDTSVDISIDSTSTSVPVSIDLNRFKDHLRVFMVPIEIQNGPSQVTYNFSLDAPKTKNLRLWSDMTPIDIKTRAPLLSEYLNRSSGAMTTIEQTKSIAEEVLSPNLTSALIPTVLTQISAADNISEVPYQNSIISNSGSGFDKLNSTHNHISVVELSRKSIARPTSTKEKRTSPPPTSSNVTFDPSVSVASTSELARILTSEETTLLNSDYGSTTVSAKRLCTNNNNTTFTDFPVVSTSALVPIPTEQSSIQHVYSSMEVSSGNTFNRDSNPLINVPTSALLPVATGRNSTQLAYGSMEDSSANQTNTFIAKNAIDVPLNQPNSRLVNSVSNVPELPQFGTNTHPINMSLNRTNVATTSSYSIPLNNTSIVSKPSVSSKIPYKPVRFRVPDLYKTKSNSKISRSNIFHNNTRKGNAPSQAGNMLSTIAASDLVKEKQFQRLSTAFCTKDNQQTSNVVNSSPHYMPCHPITTNGTYWPISTSVLPTAQSVGYSNVPVMTVNSEGSCIPEALNFNPGPLPGFTPTPAAVSNDYFSTILPTSQKSVQLGDTFNSRRHAAPITTDVASNYISKTNQNAVAQTTIPTCEGLRMSTIPSQNNYYNSNVTTTANTLAVTSCTYPPLNSPQIGPNIYPTLAGIPQHGHIRVKNMRELT